MIIIIMRIAIMTIIGREAADRGGPRGREAVGAKDYTPEFTKVKFHWKIRLIIHWAIPVKIHWGSDNPLENTTDK